MKVWILLCTLMMGAAAQAQVTTSEGAQYREFQAKILVSNGEEKIITLQMNTSIEINKKGEPEIPGHGHYDYILTGSVVENGQSCPFSVLRTQSDLEHTVDEIKSRSDRTASIGLCSGLILELSSVKALLEHSSSPVLLFTKGLSKAMGQGTLTSVGLKTVPFSDDDLGCDQR